MSDTELVAGDGEAARLVSHIRADETPHVDYLRTALSEMRDRTWVGEDGHRYAGSQMIGRLWDPLLAHSLGPGAGRGQAGGPGRGGVLVRAPARTGQTSWPSSIRWVRHEVRDLLRAPAATTVGRGRRVPLMQDALEQVELADRLGFDVVWEVEHHFLEEYSHSSAPEVFLGACSQRTRDIRLGHGIIQTAPGYNHPARTAERVATLDLISGGRVEFGTGESGSEAELGGFLVDPATKRDAWLEGLQVALRCMTETPFSGRRRTFRADAAAQCRPEADAAASPSAVGGVLTARHHPPGRREGDRGAHVRLHRPRGGGPGGCRTTSRRWPSVACPSASPSTRTSRA